MVATAATAEFALGKLDRERPDVITLDLEMPGMGGLEAIRKIMSVLPTPIVVMSAHAQKGADLTLQALDLGAVDFVLKPSSSLSGGLSDVARELVEKVKERRAGSFSPGFRPRHLAEAPSGIGASATLRPRPPTVAPRPVNDARRL